MKSLLIIISRGQQQYASQMNAAVSNLTETPDKVLVILDRPSPKELNETRKAYTNKLVEIIAVHSLPEYVGRPQLNYHVPYFCAGHARNIGVRYAIEHAYDVVIFIDGDCYPEPDLIIGHMNLLVSDEACVTVGKRCEAKYGWHDQREKDVNFPIPIFSNPERITREAFFVDSGVMWTCNMGLNRKAIDMIMHMNMSLYGRTELCSSDFIGTWGGEDGFLGMEALYGNIPVYPVCRKSSGVRHNEHPRPLDKYDHETFVTYLEEKREELMYLLVAQGMGCNGYTFVPKDIIIGNRDWISNQHISKRL